MFKPVFVTMLTALVATAAASMQPAAQQPAASDGPVLHADYTLDFPASYREWMFLSSGLGMNYGPTVSPTGRPALFTNVYVNPSSYRAFLKTGAWPDRTMFVLEVRGAASEGSINKTGQFQTGLRAIEANVKDARLPGGWGFYNFGRSQAAIAPLPQTADCYTCHRDNTAVEHTFVQFYPELMEVARKMGTVKATYRDEIPK